MSSLCLTKTFFMRVVISDLRALLYVRSLRDKRVRASLFCAARTTNVPLAGVAVPAARRTTPSGLGSVLAYPTSIHSYPSRDRDERTRARRPTRTVPTHSIRRVFARVSRLSTARPPPPTARHRVHVEPRLDRDGGARRRIDGGIDRRARAASSANERTDEGKIHAPLLANGAAFTAWKTSIASRQTSSSSDATRGATGARARVGGTECPNIWCWSS